MTSNWHLEWSTAFEINCTTLYKTEFYIIKLIWFIVRMVIAPATLLIILILYIEPMVD